MTILLFSSPRSKSASTLSRDGTHLHILSGESEDSETTSTTMHSVGLEDHGEERKIVILGDHKDEKYASLQASAVSLSSGDVLITGGIGQERQVYLFKETNQARWTRRQPMNHPRSGHASARVVLGRNEKVLVAGGWIPPGQHPQASVEIYTPEQDSWQLLPSMPTARVDFTLQVIKCSCNGIISFICRLMIQR